MKLRNEKILKMISTIMLISTLILGVMGNNNVNGAETVSNTTAAQTTATSEVLNETGNTIEELEPEPEPEKTITVAYNSHVQDLGWEKDFSKKNGVQSGTTGQNKKVEAVKIKLVDAPAGGAITYQTFVNGTGWQKEVSNGEVSGTTGKNLKLEGIKIKLTGLDNYSVEYRTHVQDVGWMSWVKDGELSGVVGKNKKIEAIEIRVVLKTATTLLYRSHVQDIGWEEFVTDGETSGTIGQNKKVEAISIEFRNPKVTPVNIMYQSHVQDLGWESEWKQNGQESGTTGKNKKIEAIRIKLDNTYKYSVSYRAYLQGKGWQEWKKDGEIAGTTGENRRLEAIEIKIEEKTTDDKFTIVYQSHVQDIGWQDYVGEGKTSGVSGKGLKVEALKIVGINLPTGVTIKYQSHVQDLGWEKDWKQNGAQTGTTGQNKKVEAVKIKLEGTTEYSIMYRSYVQGKGWQDWANDGEVSGTTGKNLKLEAIEIKLAPRISNKIKVGLDIGETTECEKQDVTGWVMTDIANVKVQLLVNGTAVDASVIKRVARADILESVKGYGGQDKNPTPGVQTTIDFTKYKVGDTVSFKIQCLDSTGKVLAEAEKSTKVIHRIEYSEGTYGKSGLKIAGKGGSDLKYYQYGHGPNVLFATFAIHGYEDLWAKDGQELVTIANTFYKRLIDEDKADNYRIADKWTVYIFPGVNMDGLTNGTTQDGPGRTTLYSAAPYNKGIDLNRCWQMGSSYVRYTSNRNYNGTTGFQAYEAQALRDFFISHKSKDDQTLLVDLHGWYQQFIGDPTIAAFYAKTFPENDKSALGRYGTQFMINWARTYLPSSRKAAKAMLLELPYQGVKNHQSVVDKDFANRYTNATLDMLRNMSL